MHQTYFPSYVTFRISKEMAARCRPTRASRAQTSPQKMPLPRCTHADSTTLRCPLISSPIYQHVNQQFYSRGFTLEPDAQRIPCSSRENRATPMGYAPAFRQLQRANYAIYAPSSVGGGMYKTVHSESSGSAWSCTQSGALQGESAQVL